MLWWVQANASYVRASSCVSCCSSMGLSRDHCHSVANHLTGWGYFECRSWHNCSRYKQSHRMCDFDANRLSGTLTPRSACVYIIGVRFADSGSVYSSVTTNDLSPVVKAEYQSVHSHELAMPLVTTRRPDRLARFGLSLPKSATTSEPASQKSPSYDLPCLCCSKRQRPK